MPNFSALKHPKATLVLEIFVADPERKWDSDLKTWCAHSRTPYLLGPQRWACMHLLRTKMHLFTSEQKPRAPTRTQDGTET